MEKRNAVFWVKKRTKYGKNGTVGISGMLTKHKIDLEKKTITLLLILTSN